MLSTLSAVAKAISLAAAAVAACVAVSAAEPAHPDFTGLWTGHREAGQGRASGFGGPQAGLPLTEEGKQRIADYNKLLGPERANPAAYCVDYGVPTVMELPGGYPIEFIQKPEQLTIIYEVENETRRVYIGDRQLPSPSMHQLHRLPVLQIDAGNQHGNLTSIFLATRNFFNTRIDCVSS